MYARVIRGRDVTPDNFARFLARVQYENAPAGKIQILHDAAQRTAIMIQPFDTAEDMAEAMDVPRHVEAALTPGTLASIDRCEIAELSSD